MHTLFKTLLIALLAGFSAPGFAQWKLVWADEFTQEGAPDAQTWNFEQGFVRNHEAQWYQPANATCKDGFLIIEARKERVSNPAYKPGSENWKEKQEFAEYTSASITTRNKKTWQYGRFEMRARINTQPGMWPAFWTLGEKGEWPDNGEIDIMEYYRGDLLANLAWGSGERFKPIWNSVKKPVKEFDDPQWADKFHIWRMDWDEQFVRLYVDDQLLTSQEIDKAANVKNKSVQPFRQPHYMVLNLAIGGDNGGDPAGTQFPARFEVDYVRVYEKAR
ncbi:glycoside hydrolase family 16 protein [Dyadobacter sandarakinus]|uniref:Glycoside hydrolase family 16 protein n=1 Tax=Dyadobacter sandarakinus TaxID=2747268 RepID=A0ABX7IBF5_9BACT|nr:glycoside hydrolase family 16 protein [Dyadobacter sandarakinus]QRR03452.1 glycoside hydrolase family 16 protein [Dyadobacter sandarakinus]